MFCLIIDAELRDNSIFYHHLPWVLRGSEFSGHRLEETVAGTNLSLPFKTRFLKVGVNAIQIHTDNIWTADVRIYITYIVVKGQQLCKVHMKETVTIQVKLV